MIYLIPTYYPWNEICTFNRAGPVLGAIDNRAGPVLGAIDNRAGPGEDV